MKPDYAIIAIVFIALCLFAVPPASAGIYTFTSGTNFTLANDGGSSSYVLKSGTWVVPSNATTDICNRYGYSAPYLDSYTDFAVRNRTTGVWAGAGSGVSGAYPRTISISTIGADSLTYDAIGLIAYCTFPGAVPNLYTYYPFYNTTSQIPPVQANFTGNPLEGVAPIYVTFTDTSQNYTNAWNWSVSPMDGVLVGPADLDNKDITILFTQDGNFTISHGASNGFTSDIETKTDYVWIHNTTETSTYRIRAVDAVSGYGINGATVSVYDIENTSWTNQTTATGEVSLTALTGHTANAYGTASGYDDGESLALPVYQGALYPIYMYPSNFGRNASAGNVTLYITVLEEGTNTRLSGMAVSLSASGGGASYTAGTTNDNGIFQVVVPNQTTYLVSVLKQKGYLGASKSVYTGTQSGGDAYVEETIWLQKDSVTPTVTATTLPGGGTPTPVQTVDPYPCDADHPENCQRKQTEMGNLLVAWGPRLMMFFLLLTFVGGFKLIGKR